MFGLRWWKKKHKMNVVDVNLGNKNNWIFAFSASKVQTRKRWSWISAECWPVSWGIYTYTHIHLFTYTLIHICTYTHIHLYTYTHIHLYTYTYTHIHLYTYTLIHIYTYTHMHLYTYTHIHLYTYTLIHIYTYTEHFLLNREYNPIQPSSQQ